MKIQSLWIGITKGPLIFCISLFFLWCANNLMAAPNSTVLGLMNEPASVWDLGMYRLEQELDSLEGSVWQDGVKIVLASVHYDYDKNKLTIKANNGIADFYEYEKARSICAILIQSVQKNFLLSVTNNGVRPLSGHSSTIVTYFSHEGYETSVTASEDMGLQLDSITEVVAEVLAMDRQSRQGMVACRSALLSNRIVYSFVESPFQQKKQ